LVSLEKVDTLLPGVESNAPSARRHGYNVCKRSNNAQRDAKGERLNVTSSTHPASAPPDPSIGAAEEGLRLLRAMQLIRTFEEQVRNLSAAGVIPGLVHLCAGQEAVAVGVCSLLRVDDMIASNHRGHGHCLAKGADVGRLMAEIMGRRTGYSLGRGGSLHIFDAANGNLGTTGVVGGGIPLATGAALSAKRNGRSQVTAAFFGDGALNQGLMFEVMNMAAIWRLPVLFVCENNGFGEFTATEDVTAGSDPLARGQAFGIPSQTVDGMDVLAVRAAAQAAIARARKGNGPSFLVCNTYRYGGHHVGDKQDYKDDAEAKAWRLKDPIERLSRLLKESNMASETTIAALKQEIEQQVRAAVEQAKAAPLPASDELEVHLYA
jgi:TPP-dependent pyruvate/acetoin dehydrogenase alpha subunit